MKSNTASALTWILGIINLSCIVGLASSKPTVPPNGVIPSTAHSTTGAPSADLTDTTTVEWGLSTVDRDITTTEILLTSESSDDAAGPFTTSIPDESPTPAPIPTKKALTTLATPEEGSATLLPAVKTTLKATGTTTQQPSKQSPSQKPAKLPVATAPRKREEVITTTIEAHTTLLQTTTVNTQTPILTTKRTTTTRVATTEPKIATQKPEPVVATTNKPTELNVVPTTLLAKTAAPVQSVVSTRVPITEGHKPVKTDGNQPKGTTQTHVLTSSEPDLGTGTAKNDTEIANSSVFSKLMLPVVLGIVAAILIICFAYGIRACKKKERNEGRRKLLHNGKDHEMKGNFDRMKLLADSSEDEF